MVLILVLLYSSHAIEIPHESRVKRIWHFNGSDQAGAMSLDSNSLPAGWEYETIPYNAREPLGLQGEWHSQGSQDRIALQLLGCRKGGYFIDLAANDAVKLSNSLALERDYGWNGLCIEPYERYLPGLKKRRCDVITSLVGEPNQTVNFQYDGVYSTVVEKCRPPKKYKVDNRCVTKYSTTFSDIFRTLKVPSVIDYMSFDIEGHEWPALKHFPWASHRVMVFTIESNGHMRPEIANALSEHNYVHLGFACMNSRKLDAIYAHRTLPNYEKWSRRTSNAAGFDVDAGCFDVSILQGCK